MKLCNDFFNKFSADYRFIYFPNEKHGTTDNQDYWDSAEITELFSNGCVNYGRFTVKLARYCNTSVEAIDNLAAKYIIKLGVN